MMVRTTCCLTDRTVGLLTSLGVWWSDSALPVQGAKVWSLTGELRPHVLLDSKRKKQWVLQLLFTLFEDVWIWKRSFS